MPGSTAPIPRQESSQNLSAQSARSYEGRGSPTQAERRHEEPGALVAHGPLGGGTPTASGSGGPVRPASARHCRTACSPPVLEDLNVIRPSRSTRSSETYGALHLAHRA